MTPSPDNPTCSTCGRPWPEKPRHLRKVLAFCDVIDMESCGWLECGSPIREGSDGRCDKGHGEQTT